MIMIKMKETSETNFQKEQTKISLSSFLRA